MSQSVNIFFILSDQLFRSNIYSYLYDKNEEIRKKIKICKESIRSLVEPKIDVTEKALALGKQKLGLMEKIRKEGLVAFPFTLMDCYGQAKIIEFLPV